MSEPFVPIEKVAEHFCVSVSTVRAWVRQEHIPKNTYVKVANTYRFSLDKVSDALLGNDTYFQKDANLNDTYDITSLDDDV